MLVKYAVDAAAVWLATRQVWSPLDYLLPSMTLREPKLRLFPAWLLVAMLLWSLPFLWIGACMTVRRALDAGRSPWLVILFFVPIVNYVTMLWLSMLPLGSWLTIAVIASQWKASTRLSARGGLLAEPLLCGWLNIESHSSVISEPVLDVTVSWSFG